MPINAPVEYFKAEEKFRNAKTIEEKIIAIEEMIRFLPKHKGTENLLAQLNAKLARLRKESTKQRKKSGKKGIEKEGEAQVCILGFANSGKSWLLSKLTDAKPEIADYPYTTTQPTVGMMEYSGVKIQLVEIPATFSPSDMSIARTSDAIVFVYKEISEKKKLEKIAEDNFLKQKRIFVNPWKEGIENIANKIWNMLDLIIVYTKEIGKKKLSPMALPRGSTVKDFAERIHKDFVKNFRFARLFRKEKGKEWVKQVGLDYTLKNGDVVELHMK